MKRHMHMRRLTATSRSRGAHESDLKIKNKMLPKIKGAQPRVVVERKVTKEYKFGKLSHYTVNLSDNEIPSLSWREKAETQEYLVRPMLAAKQITTPLSFGRRESQTLRLKLSPIDVLDERGATSRAALLRKNLDQYQQQNTGQRSPIFGQRS